MDSKKIETLTLMGRKRFDELPENIKPALNQCTDHELVKVNAILQGGMISAGYTRQGEVFTILKTHVFPNLESINGVWDYVDHSTRNFIDCKSAKYDNNTPPASVAKKYIEANQKDYNMTFVISNAKTQQDITWPVDKYKELGIRIISLQEILNETDIQIQWGKVT